MYVFGFLHYANLIKIIEFIIYEYEFCLYKRSLQIVLFNKVQLGCFVYSHDWFVYYILIPPYLYRI